MITTISEKWYHKLKRAGFVFPLCEEEAYPGKHLFFRFQEWVVGENTDSVPPQVLSEGTWVPTITELLEWLEYCGFVYTISFGYDDDGLNEYTCAALDVETGTRFDATSFMMPHAIAKVILKILKSGEREYLPQPVTAKIIED